MNTDSAYYFFIGWFLVLGSIWGLSKFEGGRTVIYYLLILAIALDLVTHSTEIANILSASGWQTNPPPSEGVLQHLGNKTST